MPAMVLLEKRLAAAQRRVRLVFRGGAVLLGLWVATVVAVVCGGALAWHRWANPARHEVLVAPDLVDVERVGRGPHVPKLTGMWADYKDAYAVGEEGALYHRDPLAGWNRIPLDDVKETLRAIHFASFSNRREGYAVGDGGTIVRFEPQQHRWLRDVSPTTSNLHAVLIVDQMALAVGDDGTALVRKGPLSPWLVVPTGTKANLHAVALDNPTANWSWSSNVLLFGDKGTILSIPFQTLCNGLVAADPAPSHWSMSATWTSIASGTDRDLLAAHSVDGWILIGGRSGTLLHMDAGLLSVPAPLDTHTSEDIVAIRDMPRGSDFWVQGAAGTTLELHRDNGYLERLPWSSEGPTVDAATSSPASSAGFGATGPLSDHVFILRAEGAVLDVVPAAGR